MNRKPEVPEGRKKELCEAIYRYIRGVWRTKEQISLEVFGQPLNATRDRQIRDMISVLKKHVPIVSPSSGKGYKAVVDAADMDEVVHQWRENDSRKEDLDGNNVPLIRFYEKHGGGHAQTAGAQRR